MLPLHGHRGKIRALAFSPDGLRLATVAGRERRVSLWDLSTGVRALSPGKPCEVHALTFSPDGLNVVFACGPHLHRWDVTAAAVREKWLRAASHCHRLAFSPDGSLLAAACFGGGDRFRVDLFRAASLPEKTFLVGDYGTPFCLTFSPDGRFLAAGGEDRCVRLWSLRDGERSFAWKCGTPVHSVAFSPDASVAAVAAGRDVTLYNPGTRRPCGALTGHEKPVRDVAFSPDGRTLLSAGDDGTVRLWDVAAGRERAAFDWKVGPVGVAAFSPDGMRAAAGGDRGLVIWDVE